MGREPPALVLECDKLENALDLSDNSDVLIICLVFRITNHRAWIKINDHQKKDASDVLAATTKTELLVTWFANKYSTSSFAWVFDFSNGAVDISKTDIAVQDWHYYFKSG